MMSLAVPSLVDVPPRRSDEARTLAAVFSRTLRAIRKHLGMDVAFISEFEAGRRRFRHVDTERPGQPIQVGDSDPLDASYCQRVIDGRLPELMANAAENAEALTLPATLALPVGAHLSVPIRLSDGRVFGTFCCFSALPNYGLTARDLDVMRVFAEVVADQIERVLVQRDEHAAALRRIDGVLRSAALMLRYQPIFDIARNRIVGFESLTRFSAEPQRGPDQWFAEAAAVGRGVELEALAIRLALPALLQLEPEVYLSVNASPATLVSGRLAELLQDWPLQRVIVEVTEHEAVEQYDELLAAIRPLQEQGLRIAIDDAGAGYASFRHILYLAPHLIKLDVSITRGIDADPARRALAAAICGFAAETGCKIVAEGVETMAELAVLRKLGFNNVQGYLIGRPMPLDQAAALCAPQ